MGRTETGERRYDVDLHATGGQWKGTFAALIRAVVEDIMADGEGYGPVEVTYDPRWGYGGPAETMTGVLIDNDRSTLSIEVDGHFHSIDIDAIVRFRF